MAEKNNTPTRSAVELHSYTNSNVDYMVMNNEQLFTHAYMIQKQIEFIKKSIDFQRDELGISEAEMQIPVVCNLELCKDPSLMTEIPFFVEYNLATEGKEYQLADYSEAMNALRQLQARIDELAPQIPDFGRKASELNKDIDNKIENLSKVVGSTEAKVAISSDLRTMAEFINTEVQNRYGEKLNGEMQTYVTRAAADSVVKLSYRIENVNNHFGVKASESNIFIKGIDAQGNAVDSVVKVSTEVIDKVVLCGRSVGSFVKDTVDYGLEAAKSINEFMHKNFINTLAVAMSLNKNMKNVAERWLNPTELYDAVNKANQLKADKQNRRDERNEKISAFLGKADTVVRTPFNIAVGIGTVIDQNLGISHSLQNAVKTARAAYDTSVRGIKEAYSVTKNAIISIPSNVKASLDNYLNACKRGGSAFIDALKSFNEIGMNLQSGVISKEAMELARMLNDMCVEIGNGEKIIDSPKYTTDYTNAVTSTAKILKDNPEAAVSILTTIYDEVASYDEAGFKAKHENSFNKVLNAVRSAGVIMIPNTYDKFVSTLKNEREESDKPIITPEAAKRMEEKKPIVAPQPYKRAEIDR